MADHHEKRDHDQENRDRGGPKKTLNGLEKIIFWVGLLFFWPVLIFLRRDAGSEYFSGEELRTPLVILWFIIVFASFVIVYLVESTLAEYFAYGAAPTRGLTFIETLLYYLYSFLKRWAVCVPFLIGVVMWVLIDPWKRSYLKSHTEE